jgi:citrate lyase beta subunit
LRANQVEPLNRGFTPTRSEGEEARELLADYEAGTRNGSAVMHLQDRIIDLATATQAGQLLAHADACAQQETGKSQAKQRSAL